MATTSAINVELICNYLQLYGVPLPLGPKILQNMPAPIHIGVGFVKNNIFLRPGEAMFVVLVKASPPEKKIFCFWEN